MKSVAFACLVAFGFALSAIPVRAQTSAPSGAPTPSSSAAAKMPSPRFGWVAPTAAHGVYQPGLTDFALVLKKRLGAALSLTFVEVGDLGYGRATGASAEACGRSRLSGFFFPHRHWRVEDTAVSVNASLAIIDCEGNIFYHGFATRTDRRDETKLPQTQLDGVQADATTDLIQKVQTFTAAHAAAWDSLIRTGTLNGTTPLPKSVLQ